MTRINRFLVLRPAPPLDAVVLQTETILPSQFAPPVPRTPEQALLCRLLTDAIGDVGLLPGRRWRRRPPPSQRPQLAMRWLLGELDAQVALPVRLVCDALGLDSGRLAAAVARAPFGAGAAAPQGWAPAGTVWRRRRADPPAAPPDRRGGAPPGPPVNHAQQG